MKTLEKTEQMKNFFTSILLVLKTCFIESRKLNLKLQIPSIKNLTVLYNTVVTVQINWYGLSKII